MEVSDVSTSLSEAALGFCTKHVHVSSHLSIHGSIAMVTDYETSIGFYSRECHNVKGRYMKKYDVNIINTLPRELVKQNQRLGAKTVNREKPLLYVYKHI